jgi:hypothetical protein
MFSIVGSLALILGLSLIVWRVSMLLRWKHRRGTVTSYLRQRGSRANAWATRVTVRFTTEGGEEIEASDQAPWNTYREGREIGVLQAPDSDPPRIVVPEFLRFWMLSLIFLPFGGVLLYVALVCMPTLP